MDGNSKKDRILQEVIREAERRRVAKVVHDERGNASVKWQDAPSDYERPVLEVVGDGGLALKNDESYDPYARRRPRTVAGTGTGNTTRDLRKLSEWIKMMRELEARKREGGEE